MPHARAPEGAAARPPEKAKTRDEDMKPDRARPANEPRGAEGSSRSDQTLTDPATGAPNKEPPAPSQSDAPR